jgi:prepilin-type N-terminal cleavage/methylation domain-containing protein
MNVTAKMKRHRAEKGFSMTELVVVVAIILIVAAVAIPNGIRVWYDMELRATSDQVASLMQQGRLMAAKNNAYYAVCYQVSQGLQQVYLNQTTLANSTPCTFTAGNKLTIDLARSITAASGAPTGTNPSAYTLATDTTSGTPCDNLCTLAFSPRGLPCKLDTSTGTCSTPASTYFVYYFNAVSANGYAAVLVTKAGRTRAFTWNGSSWN